ncbi:putative HTH-type transcriptional regulator [Baekduia alba]|uniref:TetR/AcrR family transcriptional regulator n=1 Tax=Baekduia alba TaxID=2997333 RepID=UPI00233FD933|nr:TetR/AcrR family transcriptional regulator [Baekduia alba]WCB96057.1 putative HTH-type transcriptional regulator [Baekduia alba]
MATDATRARGRPRSTEADRAIFEATRRLLDAAGYHGLTVEGVAVEAGVAKTTIYRRYANKALLVLDSMTQAAHDAPVALPDTGAFRDDLVAVAHLVREEIAPSSPSSVGTALLGEASRDPAVAERLRAFADFRFEQGKPVYDRARQRGELRPDADWRVVAELIVGWIFHASIVSRRRPDDATLERTVDLLLDGLAPR